MYVCVLRKLKIDPNMFSQLGWSQEQKPRFRSVPRCGVGRSDQQPGGSDGAPMNFTTLAPGPAGAVAATPSLLPGCLQLEHLGILVLAVTASF